MKSLSLFLILNIIFYSLFFGSSHTINNKNYVQINHKIKMLKQILPDIEKLEKSIDNNNDKSIACGFGGKNLGTLHNLNNCKSVFTDKCRLMVTRQKHPDVNIQTKVVTKMTSKGPVTKFVLKKPKMKKHWSFKQRKLKYLSYQKNFLKLPKEIRKQILIKAKANEDLKKIMKFTKQGSPQDLKKLMKSLLTTKIDINKLPKLKKEKSSTTINPSSSLQLKPEKKKLPKSGNFCVHAILYNLNYCCSYKNRDIAQSFANTQPFKPEFQKLLLEGNKVELMAKEKEAEKMIKKISNAMSIIK